MDDDWDLHAVVRGCAALIAASKASSTLPTLPSVPPPQPQPDHTHVPPVIQDEAGFDDTEPFVGLDEIIQAFLGADDEPLTTSAQAPPLPPPPPPPPPPPQINMQEFPAENSQPIRGRRKNLVTKYVREVTQDELCADSWAWRKYGQKPIKGSPYPRNYYRCSTSKGCGARKQVERSPNEAGKFIVSYSGEHTHPRPAHRSSLSGSSRTKYIFKNNPNAVLVPPSSSSTPPIDQSNDALVADKEEGSRRGDDPLPMTEDEDIMLGDFQDSDQDFLPPWTPADLLSTPPYSEDEAADD